MYMYYCCILQQTSSQNTCCLSLRAHCLCVPFPPENGKGSLNYLVELFRKESSERHSFEFVPQLVNPQAVRKRAVNQQSVSGELHRHRHRRYHTISRPSLTVGYSHFLDTTSPTAVTFAAVFAMVPLQLSYKEVHHLQIAFDTAVRLGTPEHLFGASVFNQHSIGHRTSGVFQTFPRPKLSAHHLVGTMK